MKHRWSRWMNAWIALSVPGLCVAAIIWAPGTIVALAVGLSVPLGLTLVLLKYVPPGQIHPTGTGWTSRVMLCGMSVFISLAAIAATIPGLAPLVVLGAVATAPPVMDLRRRVLGSTAQMPSTTAESTTSERPPLRQPLTEKARAMTDRQLCQAWRRTYWALNEARDPIEMLWLVEQRTRLLDELEARNAAALGAWLASGARACDGPDKFFNDDERDQPTAA